MGYKCIICNKEYIKHNGISFHTFPREYSLRKAWRKACKLQHHRVLKRARICSQHFTKDSFLPNKDYKRESMRLLKPSTVPEVFPWNLKNNLIATIDLTSQTRLESLESIEYIVTSTSKQNQDDEDCAYTNAFSSSELTIPCNNLSRTPSPENIKKCNLSRTPSNKAYGVINLTRVGLKPIALESAINK